MKITCVREGRDDCNYNESRAQAWRRVAAKVLQPTPAGGERGGAAHGGGEGRDGVI